MKWYEWVIPIAVGIVIFIAGVIYYELEIRRYCRENGYNVKGYKKYLRYRRLLLDYIIMSRKLEERYSKRIENS